MKIVSWNSSGALGKKNRLDQLLRLNPDIAVIPECSSSDMKLLKESGMSGHCVEITSEGLGVFVGKGWKVEPLDKDENFRGVAPFRVSGPVPFTLLATWAADSFGPYVKQLNNALTKYLNEIKPGKVVVAGDFDTTGAGKRQVRINHFTLVNLLRERGLESSYHAVHDESHGKESRCTYHHRPTGNTLYHIDYIFIPKTWLEHISEFSIGPHAFWKEFSDHRPVGVSLALPQVT
jgi:hypothetical protein